MQLKQVLRTTTRRTVRLVDFIMTDAVLNQLAGEAEMSPIDFLASGFVSDLGACRSFPEWLAWQTKSTLETRVMADDYEDQPGGWMHRAAKLAQIEFDAEDRQWILDTYGDRADVQEVWAEAHARAWAKAA